jgi:hypothetical protein
VYSSVSLYKLRGTGKALYCYRLTMYISIYIYMYMVCMCNVVMLYAAAFTTSSCSVVMRYANVILCIRLVLLQLEYICKWLALVL